MKRFRATVKIMLKEGILDAEAQAIEHAINKLGTFNVNNTRKGKLIVFDINSTSLKDAEQNVKIISKRLLANPIIETYNFTVEEL